MTLERAAKGKDPVILPSGGVDDATVAGLEGNYRVIRLLGRGTMASVYLAEQVSMARPVALKILSRALSSDPAFVERFLKEARASARLNHPNIVTAIEFGEFQDRFFLAMEFVDGMPLSAILAKDGALEESRVVAIALQIVSALAHAHMHNVVHLDVKPANIMICGSGVAKLADFGLAMMLDRPGRDEESRTAVGTPYYMAPEQVEGGKLDWRTDQYSLGASLYEAVTGLKPFTGKSVSDILIKRFFENPVPAWKAGRKVGRGFSAILTKMLSRSPGGRYQSFRDLENDLERVKAGDKPLTARMDAALTASPSKSHSPSPGYAGVMDRIDDAVWRKRLNLVICSSLLLLVFLGVYSAVWMKEIRGPKPSGVVRRDALDMMENLPPDLAAPARLVWSRAVRSMARAEVEPTADNLRRAIHSFHVIATDPELAETAYAAVARLWATQLDNELKLLEMGGAGGAAPAGEGPADAPEDVGEGTAE